jgi:hypothetical protein
MTRCSKDIGKHYNHQHVLHLFGKKQETDKVCKLAYKKSALWLLFKYTIEFIDVRSREETPIKAFMFYRFMLYLEIPGTAATMK